MRLIDADALIELIDGGFDLNFDEVPETKRELIRMIGQQPTIEAEPVKRGRWIKTEDGRWYCSECKKEDYYAFLWDVTEARYELQDNYCPNCGARMEEES